jgi:hypothetical protein
LEISIFQAFSDRDWDPKTPKNLFGSHCFVDWVFSCKTNLRTISAKSEHFSRNRSIWVLQIQNFSADCSDLKELKEHLRKMYQKKIILKNCFSGDLGFFGKPIFRDHLFFGAVFLKDASKVHINFCFFSIINAHDICLVASTVNLIGLDERGIRFSGR